MTRLKEEQMKKIALIFVTVATLATTLASPVEARGWRGGGWGWGPGIGLGIAAGSLAAGAYGAYGPYGPYGYGPRYYGYYGPRPYWGPGWGWRHHWHRW